MEKIKKALDRIFIEGLSAMAQGLFATLIIGTIIQQIGTLMGGTAGDMIFVIGKAAASLTGAGIGAAVAYRFRESPLVVVSAATAGMVGAFASKLLAGAVLVEGAMVYAGPGEPLGAFIAAYVGIFFGHLVSGRTKVDILVTPLVSIGTGSAVGLILGPPISGFMEWLGAVINWGTEQQPLFMGIIVSVLMGMILTLPISSAALGIILNLSGLAAGAATVGCCCNGWVRGGKLPGEQGGRTSGSRDRHIYAAGSEYCEKAGDLASGHIIQRGSRAGRDDGAAYDKQCHRIWDGYGRAGRAEPDVAADHTDRDGFDGDDKDTGYPDYPACRRDFGHLGIYAQKGLDQVRRHEA